MLYDDNQNEDKQQPGSHEYNNQETGTGGGEYYDNEKVSAEGEGFSERGADSGEAGNGREKPKLRIKRRGEAAASENDEDNSAKEQEVTTEKTGEENGYSAPEPEAKASGDESGAQGPGETGSAESGGEVSGEATQQKKLRLARSPGGSWAAEEQEKAESGNDSKATYAAGASTGGAERTLLPEVVSIILFAAGNILTQLPSIRTVTAGGEIPVQEFGITGGLIVVFGLFIISRRGLLKTFSGILLLIAILWCGGVVMNALSVSVPTIPAKFFGVGDMSQLPTLTVAAVALCIFISAFCLFAGGGKMRWSVAVIFVMAALAMPWLSLQEYAAASEDDGGEKTAKAGQKEKVLPKIGKESWRELLPIKWEMKKSDEAVKKNRGVAFFNTSNNNLNLSIYTLSSNKNDKTLKEAAKEKYKNLQDRFPDSRLAFINIAGNNSCAKVSVFGSSRLDVFILAVKGRYYEAELKGDKEDFSHYDSLIQQTDSAFKNAAEFFDDETESDQS